MPGSAFRAIILGPVPRIRGLPEKARSPGGEAVPPRHHDPTRQILGTSPRMTNEGAGASSSQRERRHDAAGGAVVRGDDRVDRVVVGDGTRD